MRSGTVLFKSVTGSSHHQRGYTLQLHAAYFEQQTGWRWYEAFPNTSTPTGRLYHVLVAVATSGTFYAPGLFLHTLFLSPGLRRTLKNGTPLHFAFRALLKPSPGLVARFQIPTILLFGCRLWWVDVLYVCLFWLFTRMTILISLSSPFARQ